MLQVISVGSIVLPVLLSQMEEESAPGDESSLSPGDSSGGECDLSAVQRIAIQSLLAERNDMAYNMTLASILD